MGASRDRVQKMGCDGSGEEAPECIATVDAPRNEAFAKLGAGYLFPVIGKKKGEYIAKNPEKGKTVISCGVGDTTHPLPEVVGEAMATYAEGLTTGEGYSGYDPKVTDDVKAELLKVMYKDMGFEANEVFVSDGSKCDLARFQTMFHYGKGKVAIPDPAYPAYVDNTVLSGHTGKAEGASYPGITYLPCSDANGFFPDYEKAVGCNLMYFCNPNNPTGACATREQLTGLVEFAIKNKILIIYDAAYAYYIRDDKPKSIFEIEGAKKVAIETNSFSKLAGFTGVRLGWTVVPKEITYADGGSARADFNRVFGTHFNGACNVAMAGGLAVLKNMDKVQEVLDFYKGNADLIRATMTDLGFKTMIGGDNSPYIFVKFPGKDSWAVFDWILENCQVVTTPGVGFGPSGQSFVRISSYGKRENIEEACKRFKAAGLKEDIDVKAAA